MTFLAVGDPAPWFTAASSSNPNYHFNTVGGYRVVLSFLGSASLSNIRPVVDAFSQLQEVFAHRQIPFFAVSIDPKDTELESLIRQPSYFKWIWDGDRAVSRLYGVLRSAPDKGGDVYTPMTFILNEALQIIHIIPMLNPDTHVQQVMDFLATLPPPEAERMADRQAPVLFIPNVFSRDFCQELIQRYYEHGGRDSGFMRQIDGKTVEVFDYKFKKRRDFAVTESPLLTQINDLMIRRVKPMIERAYQFSITRFERHLVACYEASSQGFFNRHRDNTTKGTAHRRFAMSINLNTGEYEGGCLRFPEYGTHLYRPGVGEAVIFSCSLLHEATPVTQGKRFALLSFFYNDDDARVREQNQKYVDLDNKVDYRNSSTLNQASARHDSSDTPPTPAASKKQKKSAVGFQPKSRQR
jgi:peroxiredoxin/predicted 2-oxoglutarate/Fe(II)-dependent dioxygenase YbiX